ncbi:MAG: hypothetical protein AAFU85_17070 [Planctomycetota bacterium]
MKSRPLTSRLANAPQQWGSSVDSWSSRLMLVFAAALLFIPSAGCSRLRLPAIDPTGRRIFQPLPTTTSIALPGSAGEGGLGSCLRRLGDPLNLRPFQIPDPAFPEPAPPPKCLTPKSIGPRASAAGQPAEACVPSAPCTADCKDGPPAVLLGNETKMRELCRLPKRGKRGCILLSPQKIVAPVGGEVILLSGICGTDGYLQVAEPLEWMLTPESVGTFIQVGDDDPGLLHRLARVQRADKEDPSFAKGVTSTKQMLITRGNLNPNDDVQLEKGQTWISISSPSEGTSKVTVLAPESDCWDQRKATATIYWVDARWQFPGTQIVPAGTPVELNTRVTRSEGTLPAVGWKVRYEIMNPDLALFSNGSTISEATVDDAGNALAQLVPLPGTSGTATVNMQVIRPGGVSDNIPTLPISNGQTFVTWSAPQLALRAGAPSVASFGVPFQTVVNVSNPGNQPAEDVRVIFQIPAVRGVSARSPDAFARNVPTSVVWEIPAIPARSELDLFLDVTTESPIRLTFEARGRGDLFASDVVAVDVYRPSLALSVSPLQERYEVGQNATFHIDVRNTGTRPLDNLKIAATGDSGMLHRDSNERSVANLRETGPLQPGETWELEVDFIPTDAGRRCIEVEATADAGQRATTSSCVTVVNQPPPTPALTLTLNGRGRTSVGETTLFRGVVANTGRVPLQNVEVTMTYDPQLTPLGATELNFAERRPGQYLLKWLIPRLDPQTSETLEAEFRVIGSNPRSSFVMTANSAQGARDSKRLTFEALPAAGGTGLPGGTPRATPSLPPVTPPPTVPRGGPRPIQNDPPATAPRVPRAPVEAPRLGLELIGPPLPVQVNQPIDYTLRVTNPSSTPDSNISIRFNEPEGVSVVRVSQTLNPQQRSPIDPKGGWIYLQDIRSMRPGETIEYKIVLTCNQPKTFQIRAEALSQNKRDGAASEVTTVVVPQP